MSKRKVLVFGATLVFLTIGGLFVPFGATEKAVGPYGNLLTSAVFVKDARASTCYIECDGTFTVCNYQVEFPHLLCTDNGNPGECYTIQDPQTCP